VQSGQRWRKGWPGVRQGHAGRPALGVGRRASGALR
jgi:hypothetical protein